MLANNLAGVLGSEKDMRSKWRWLWSDPRHHLYAVSMALFVHVLSHQPPNCPALCTASAGLPKHRCWDGLCLAGVLSLEGKEQRGCLERGRIPRQPRFQTNLVGKRPGEFGLRGDWCLSGGGSTTQLCRLFACRQVPALLP